MGEAALSISNEQKQGIIALLKNCEIRKLCDTYFDDNFLWTIKGTSILSGTYNNKEEFFEKVINRLNKLLSSGWRMHILNSYTDNNTLIIEMRGEVKTKNGADYNNEYCWIFKFNDKNKVANLTAYYDSLLVNKTLNENE